MSVNMDETYYSLSRAVKYRNNRAPRNQNLITEDLPVTIPVVSILC